MTTHAHVEARGAVATDLGGTGHENFDRPDPFKGDIDLNALEASRGWAGGPRRLAD